MKTRYRPMALRSASFAVVSTLAFVSTHLGSGPAHADEPSPAVGDADWVFQRVAAWQPTQAERAFDLIGWVDSVPHAQQLSTEHARPLFLFTYDGASLAGYRC